MASSVMRTSGTSGSAIYRRGSCLSPTCSGLKGVDFNILATSNEQRIQACCLDRPVRSSTKIVSAKKVASKVSRTRLMSFGKGEGKKSRKGAGREQVDKNVEPSAGSLNASERAQTRASAGSGSFTGSDSLHYDTEIVLGVNSAHNGGAAIMEDFLLTDEEVVTLRKLLQEGLERKRRCCCENDGTPLGLGMGDGAAGAVSYTWPRRDLPSADTIPDVFTDLLVTTRDRDICADDNSREVRSRSSSDACFSASYNSAGTVTAGDVGQESGVEGSTWGFDTERKSKETASRSGEANPLLQTSHTDMDDVRRDSTAIAASSRSSMEWAEPEGCRVGEAESMGVVLHQGVFQEVWSRGRWLLGLLVLQSGSGVVLQMYEDLIQDHLVITLFLTMLVGAGGNAGNQSAIKVIRELATGEVDLTSTSLVACLKEQLLVGVLLAAALAGLGFVRVFATNGDLRNSIAIASSLFLIVLTSVGVGTTLPFVLAWRGVDPANAGTSVQVAMDLLGVGITCAICSLVYSVPALPLHATMAAL